MEGGVGVGETQNRIGWGIARGGGGCLDGWMDGAFYCMCIENEHIRPSDVCFLSCDVSDNHDVYLCGGMYGWG